MESQNTPSLKEEEQQKKRRWILLLLLIFLALITSCIVGFILGRNAGTNQLGQVIDTIIVGDEETSVRKTFHLTGKVTYSNGEPVAGRVLELHSDPITTTTVSNGAFLFANVPEGTHTIYVMNTDGSIAAQREIQVVHDEAADGVSVDLKSTGEYVIEMAVDVRMLEIMIQLDGEDIYIDPDHVTYAKRDGTVTTPSGTASIKDGVVVTPAGNVILPDGTIVLPGGSENDPTYMIQNDDVVVVNRPYSNDGIQVTESGVVSLPNGTVIAPGGTITMPDGEIYTPGESGVVVDDEIVKPIGGQNPDRKDDSTSKETASGTTKPAQENAGTSSGNGGTSDTSEPSGEPDSEEPDTPESPQEPSGGNNNQEPEVPDKPVQSDDGELQVSGQNQKGQYIMWGQTKSIDLFYNHATGKNEKIAPGSKGYYLFRLKNTRKEKLAVTLSIAEAGGSPSLPLKFTLRPQQQKSGGSTGTLTKGKTLKLDTSLGGSSNVVYRLDWEWPYESGRDAEDTAAGEQGGRYTLNLSIHAESSTK